MISSRLTSFILLLLLAAAPVIPADNAPELTCRSAILYDLESGALLYEKNADDIIPPASMTKLMTLHLAFRAVRGGKLSFDQLVPVTQEASYKSSPPRSSLMFIEEGQKVTLLELMKGLAVSSGNDAGVAVAQAVAGSVDEFLGLMNREAERLGLVNTKFRDSSGYSSMNTTTAREFARFCMIYLGENPDAVSELHSLKEYTYPQPHNIAPGGRSSVGPVQQFNNNRLLGILEGVDGLKTGFIDESGYNFALTAERGGRRLLAVTMGGPEKDGILSRAVDGAVLLSYGYYYYKTFYPSLPPLPERRVYGGSEKKVGVTAMVPAVTLPREEAGMTQWVTEWGLPLEAPLSSGTVAGKLRFLSHDGKVIFESDLVAEKSVGRGSFLRRLTDSIILFITSLLSPG